MPDIRVENHGSVMLLRPCTPVGKDWMANNIQAESWQYFGDALACEPRYAPDLVEGMLADGLEVG